MKDFQIRNDTKLLFCKQPAGELSKVCAGKRVLFVYGGSAKSNGCLDDVRTAVQTGGGVLFEFPGASRELIQIESGIALAKENGIELVVGAGGASVMDCAKLIAFGSFHGADLWDYVKGRKNPRGEKRLPLVLIPTYPSSGSEYGLGAVAADSRTGDFGTAYGIAADTAVLVPKYSLTLGAEMTAYTALVTLVQLSASTIGDKNPLSYGIGISVIKNVLAAAKTLQEHPCDEDARGVVLYGASLSTSGRLGLGKEENYAYDIYEVEFIPEVLYGAPYRKSLTTLFPRFLKTAARRHEDDIRRYFSDAFDFEGTADESAARMTELFSSLGVDMYFDGSFSAEKIGGIKIAASLSAEEVAEMVKACLR